MTITSNNRRNQYTANGSQTAFTYTFEIFADADLKVYVDTALQTLTTDYTVGGAGTDSGGTVTFTTAPTNSTTVAIYSDITVARTTSFNSGGVFRAEDINTELDKIIAMVNELDTNLSRTVRLPVTDGDKTLELPISATRAGKFMTFDSSGNIQASTNVGEWKGNWVSGTSYIKNDVVKDSSNANIYISVADYTSGANVAADVTAGNLILIIDVSAASTAATASATSATASASSATASATSATASATSATASASSATDATNNGATQVALATTQANNSATSATASASSATASASSATAATNNGAAQVALATTQANNSATSATASATSATASASSATAAASSASAAAASLSAIDGEALADSGGDTTVEVARTGHANKIFLRANDVDALAITESGGTATATFSSDVAINNPVAITNTLSLNGANALRFNDTDSSHYVALKSPGTVAANITWTLPNADAGVSGYALTSDGSGNLSWSAAGATVAQDNTSNANFNLYFASTTSGALTAVKYDGADLTFNPSTSTLTCTNFSGTSSSARYADLAEIYAADCELSAGDVVKIGGEKEVTLCDANDLVFGVVSTAPGFLLNAGASGYPIALKGRVPVKFIGTAKKGQRVILSNKNGVATAAIDLNNLNPFWVIGRAVEDKTTGGEGELEIILN
jgi:hypothetical protein